VYGFPLDAPYAVAFALAFMIADQGADNGKGIVLEKDLRSFHHPVLLEKADDLRNIGLNGTSLHAAAGILALKASVGFV
jgi:hypothetical protein